MKEGSKEEKDYKKQEKKENRRRTEKLQLLKH